MVVRGIFRWKMPQKYILVLSGGGAERRRSRRTRDRIATGDHERLRLYPALRRRLLLRRQHADIARRAPREAQRRGYTARRRPVVLVFQQDFDRVTDAIAAERQLKG